MEAILERQSILSKEIDRINTNFRKDSASRKTSEYLLSRLAALDKCWKEFDDNHSKLLGLGFEDEQHEYFSKNIYGYMKDYYLKTKDMISSYKEPKLTTFSLPIFEEYSYQGDDLISQQETNFRALDRVINRIHIEDLEEKWELQDELKNLQNLWKIIDNMHLRLDNQLNGSNSNYENKFLQIEERYLSIKRELNRKLNATAHLEQATPKLEVPVFYGKYTQWPTFFDLFVETIHNNKCLSKAQKMQHLKGKVKGEAEGLIQHLNISAENYETAWDILTHRYNNPQILFSTQIDIFLNQPPISKQSSYHVFKKLHDTTTQCINSIRNLGIDISTWDPILVHLLSKKLDEETRTDFMESRESPRDLASYTEFLHFLENKFMAREPIGKKEKNMSSDTTKSNSGYTKPLSRGYPPSNHTSFYKKYQSNATNNKRSCPVCRAPHDLFQCKRFISQSADAKLMTLSKYNICRNCLYKHYENKCMSTKRCKECNGDHNSLIHDAILTTKSQSQHLQGSQDSPSTSKISHNVNYVASENEEILLTTVALNIKASDGTFFQFRALLDQGSQISLISENAAQLLGLKRQFCRAAVSGIGSTQKTSKGLVSLDCVSIYNDYYFTTEALVVSRVISNLPNSSFNKQSWPHLSHTRLADPEYNISKPIDLLLDASVYSDIIMSGLIKGPVQAPIAQQTKLGWILSGNVKTFACNVVVNEMDSISKFWEIEDIHDSATTLSSADQYCEDYYQTTTKRLSTGQYQVALPMKPNYVQEMGASRSKAIAQFIQQERRNEAIMNHQFAYMSKQMKLLLKEWNNVRSDSSEGLYLTSSALSAYVAISNLRRMQQDLTDVITDIYHGRIDTHLFPPEELESQINIITREIQDDLNVPLEKGNIRSLYKLLRIFARVHDDYLIMEIKIPLITTETYELDKVISLQRMKGESYQITPSYPYLAFNLRKDLVLFFTENDLQMCLHANPEKILCSIDKPIYAIKGKTSICDIKINDIITSLCIQEQSKCDDNKWIKLRRPADWLYQCCQQCTVRIFGTRDTEVKTLSGNGIISLCPGCTLKGDSYEIYSHKNFINHVDHHYAEESVLPRMSVVNDIVNTSVVEVEQFLPEDHHKLWKQLNSQLEDLKQQQSEQPLSVHDVHQYSVLYSLVGVAVLTAIILTIIWIKRRWRQQPPSPSGLDLEEVRTVPRQQPQPRPRQIIKSKSTPNLNSVKFEIPFNDSE